MQITLNEYTLALLCGGISCLTYLLTTSSSSFLSSNTKSVRIQDGGKRRKSRKTILKSANSETNESVDDDDLDDEADTDEQSRSSTRRQSYSRSSMGSTGGKTRRSDSVVKSDHVIFADEIQADDEKFSPVHDEITDDMIEGILSKSEEEHPLSVNFNLTEVEPLNHFAEIQPLDDHDLLIRRRSLHSTPSGSHRGSRNNLATESDPDGTHHSSKASDGHTDEELILYKNRVRILESELSDVESAMAEEKRELEHVLEEAGLDKSDLAGSVRQLNQLLQAALLRIYPDASNGELHDDDDLLQRYLANRRR